MRSSFPLVSLQGAPGETAPKNQQPSPPLHSQVQSCNDDLRSSTSSIPTSSGMSAQTLRQSSADMFVERYGTLYQINAGSSRHGAGKLKVN